MTRHRIAVFVRDGVLAMELGTVHRTFGEARGALGEPLYEVVTCALRAGPVRTDGDFTIDVEHGPDLLAEASTVVVAATDHDQAAVAEFEASGLGAAMRRIRPGTRVACVCTAAFVLAAAGRLDGRSATTHWAHLEEFRARHPGVRIRADALYTDDGDVLTSAGVASGADLWLHMIRGDHGVAVANAVSRRVVLPPHRAAGEAQFLARPLGGTGVAGTARARRWAIEHLDETITLRRLAAQESVSVRTFTRRFREETGTSPTRWLLARRLDRARELLETTTLDVDAVASRCGFGSASTLRWHMRAALHVSPLTYRRSFRPAPRAVR